MWSAAHLWLALALGPDSAATLPHGPTPVDQLSPPGFSHTELLRITRDFGKPQWEIVMDGWTAAGSELADVRLWWAKTDASDERRPFGDKIRSRFRLHYRETGPTSWEARLRGDGKSYRFQIRMRGEEPATYVDLVDEDGSLVPNCKATRSRLVARRFLGIPVGIGKLEVTCVDRNGDVHHGELDGESA